MEMGWETLVCESDILTRVMLWWVIFACKVSVFCYKLPLSLAWCHVPMWSVNLAHVDIVRDKEIGSF
jgi:hypothetical protein